MITRCLGCGQYKNGPGKVSSGTGRGGGPRRWILTAILLIAAGSGSLRAAKTPERDWNLPSPDWYQGPVRYLLVRGEEKEYRALTTEAERSRFIETFWARRDQDPSTPANEFRIRFFRRVQEADRLFQDAPFPGWKTDRGKLYILLGAPDEIREGQATTPLGKEIPFVIWYYHQPRFEGMDRETEIRFTRDDSGEMKISDRLAMNRLETYAGTARELALRASAAQVSPEPRDLLDSIVAARPAVETKDFPTHYDFFKASDGSTSVVVTVGVPRSDSSGAGDKAPSPPAPAAESWTVCARFVRDSAAYDLAAPDSFRTVEAARDVDGVRLFQGRISVPPGRYTVYYAVQNVSTHELRSLSDPIAVPDFTSATFSLSGITLAARLEPAERPEADSPFVVGRLVVIPKMKPTFQTGSDLAYYFQVYDPEKDPGTGSPSLDLTYRFLRANGIEKTGEAAYEPIGKPLLFERQTGLVHGYAFPLQGWPKGEYKLRISVHDRISDRTLESEVDFGVR
jgi:GWxTD domain-containing protein